MTAERLHDWLGGLRSGGGQDLLDAVVRFVRDTPYRGRLELDDAYEVIGQVLQEMSDHGPCDPEQLLQRVRRCANRLAKQRRREAERPPLPPPDAGSLLPDASLLDAQAHAAVSDAITPYLHELHQLAAATIDSYRFDRRVGARHTWDLWWWQRSSGPEFRSVHELVARAYHGTVAGSDRVRWRRHRDRLMRRRSRFRARMREVIDARSADGLLHPYTARHLCDHVLPWLSNHSQERA